MSVWANYPSPFLFLVMAASLHKGEIYANVAFLPCSLSSGSHPKVLCDSTPWHRVIPLVVYSSFKRGVEVGFFSFSGDLIQKWVLIIKRGREMKFKDKGNALAAGQELSRREKI